MNRTYAIGGRKVSRIEYLESGPIMTLQEVADALGTTDTTVQRIERRALKKIAAYLEKRGFTA